MVEHMGQLMSILICPPPVTLHPSTSTTLRRSPWFTYCIGAIDGTHALGTVAAHVVGLYCDCTGRTTQINLIVVDFDGKLSFSRTRRESSIHGVCMLADARKKTFKMPPCKNLLEGDNNDFQQRLASLD